MNSAQTVKTFFITLTAGQEIRDFLLSDFYTLAKNDPHIRIIAFLPPDQAEKYKREFGHERCIIEPIVGINNKWMPKELFRIVCFGCIPTRTIWSRNWFTYLGGGSLPSFVTKQFLWILGHSRIWRSLMRMTEYYIFHDDNVWKPYFEKYKPDVVFGSAMIFEEDVLMIKFAKRQGIPTVGMMRSWDNFTSKGFIRVHPDRLFVQNSTMVEEAYTLNSFPKERIDIIGFPQWDHYYDPSWQMTREEFADKFKLDPKTRWVVFFGGGLMTGLFGMPDRGDHVVMLNQAVRRGELSNITVILRAHPAYTDALRPEALESPVLDFGKGWNFTVEDMKLLLNLVRFSDVALNVGSTIALEVAMFDKPVVLIGFNGYDTDEKLPWHRRLSTALNNTVHYLHVQQTGGVWRVNNETELIHAVKTYLENPALHKEGRARIVKELVGPTDGKAATRVFQILRKLADSKALSTKL